VTLPMSAKRKYQQLTSGVLPVLMQVHFCTFTSDHALNFAARFGNYAAFRRIIYPLKRRGGSFPRGKANKSAKLIKSQSTAEAKNSNIVQIYSREYKCVDVHSDSIGWFLKINSGIVNNLKLSLRLNSIQYSRAMGRDSSVGIATRYGLVGPGIECRWGRDFLHLS
jgi:hypothetical protein